MSTAEILRAIDTAPPRSKKGLMAKIYQRLEDYYDVQAVAAAHKSGEWYPLEQVEAELKAKRAKAGNSGKKAA
jgi:hypothetical protein